jgi:aminomethyltransferase
MGEVRLSGRTAGDFLNHALTNDVKKLAVGQAQYSLLCNPAGGVIDDLYVYHLAASEYLLIINASRIEADTAWLNQECLTWPGRQELRLEDASDQYGAVAAQGPRVIEFINQAFPGAATLGMPVRQPGELKKNQIAGFPFQGQTVLVARTGYSGEDGFEAVAPAGQIEGVWERLLELGRSYGLKPTGLGARDTLRTEMCYPLYGHELDEQTTPIEAGLGFFVALDKPEFTGRAVMADQKASGVTKKCVAFKMTDKSAPPRPHYPIWSTGPNAGRIGEVTSGTQSPCLGVGIGLGYVPPAFAAVSTPLAIEIRGKRAPAVVVSRPIYRKG